MSQTPTHAPPGASSRTAPSTATAPAVLLDGAVKRFGDLTAVDGVTLAVPPGQTVALLGPNGAGKSTSIAMMLGLLPPDAGRARIFDQDPEQAVRQGRVGAMAQEGGLISRVRVAELIRFVAGAYPRPMPLPDVLAVARLTDLANHRVDRLSGGQGQRVRFAMAIAGDPDLIVLDEPTAALDVAARRDFWASMRRFAARGKTILFSTHYLEEADEHADRIVVVDRGRVVADGSSDEVKRAVALTTVSVRVPGAMVGAGAGGGTGVDRLAGERLAGLPGVDRVEWRGDRATLRTRDADATVLALAAAGLVRDVEVVRANLEDAFLALTSQS